MKINNETGIHNPGDWVYVPMRIGDKVKPSKERVASVHVIMDSRGDRVEYYTENGSKLPELTYKDPWNCQKAIDILEKYKRLSDQEIDALIEQIKKDGAAKEEKCLKAK